MPVACGAHGGSCLQKTHTRERTPVTASDVKRTPQRAVAELRELGSHLARDGERLLGADAVRARLTALSRRAEREWLALGPASAGLRRGTLQDAAPLEAYVLKRGVALRSIYRESFRNEPALLRCARDLALLGGETRTVPVVPTPVVIVDQEVGLLPLDPGDPLGGAVEVRDAGTVRVLHLMFEQLWTAATPWKAPGGHEGDSRHGRDHALLLLLCEGHTDESISRRLGVSLRTVRRLVADLMQRLDARSRFQAGVQAARRGWL
ncbi:helix-turn-helix transcriptional regulator [Streptomyces sp. Go40/10]|uniref:helix-turn-helix transcriptional regulator n=1 Tax=Streptomyces sp. Go40/10 TaxID=2825844 RepID=UPI001E344EBA|nr:helix-turn-helix transcriptional regulator [Streptomyces sp. Go40/10]UFR03537.1 helix-turn-helix transcriptional regulator [Streptomyces sp. Go40/10]